MLGLSQKSLASAIGVKFPQVQKYEEGVNRISASRLFAVSRVLEESISYFFDRMDDEVRVATPGGLSDAQQAFIAAADVRDRDDEGMFLRPETLDLVRIYYKVDNRRVRRSIVLLMEMLAELEEGDDGGPP